MDTKAREQLEQYHQSIIATCQKFNPILADYIYPHTFNLSHPGMIARDPARFVEAPYHATTHAERMEYAQGAAFARWQSEDQGSDGHGDRHCPVTMWMRRLMDVSGIYTFTHKQSNPDRSTTTYQARVWQYNLATLWAASILAPLVASWDLVFRYEQQRAAHLRDLENDLLMVDFQISPTTTLTTPAYYLARSLVEHARKTGKFGDIGSAILSTYYYDLNKDTCMPFYQTLIAKLEAHGHHDRARQFYFHLRPDIRNSAYDEVVVPFAGAERWVNHNEAVAAYESEHERPAPTVATTGDMRALARMERHNSIQWYWYCCWRYGYALDWKSLMWITDNLPESHPLLGIRRWMTQFT